MKKKMNQGFSLVELIIVIAIMAVLIGVLAPQYFKYVERSKKTVDEDTADELLKVGNVLVADEQYGPFINSGDKIEFSVGGITTNPSSSALVAGLNEYSNGWQDKKVKSNTYRTMTYIVEFEMNSGATALGVAGSWQP